MELEEMQELIEVEEVSHTKKFKGKAITGEVLVLEELWKSRAKKLGKAFTSFSSEEDNNFYVLAYDPDTLKVTVLPVWNFKNNKAVTQEDLKNPSFYISDKALFWQEFYSKLQEVENRKVEY